ncbi:MAG: sialidase family protein, partial [Verrucomicrobiota bacterium]
MIAVADGRIGSCGDIPTPIDLVCKRSFDNGRSWEPLQIIANYGSDPADVDDYPFYGATSIQRVAAGDAAMLVDQVTGRIWTL